MPNTFGRILVTQTGQPIRVSFDGSPDWKAGGITLDWTTVPAVSADTTLLDGAVIKAGYSGLVFGTVLAKITATGKYGPFTPAMTATTTSGATVIGATQLPLTAVVNINPGDTLSIDSAGQLETAVVQSIVGSVANLVAPLTKTHAGGVAVTKPNDGRQVLAAGETFILDQTVLQNAPYTLAPGATDHPAVLEGGSVWAARLQVGGTNQPTLAAVMAVLPRLRLVEV